jgi:saccharopine dehydrogenase-like NADP-dependent oxidoreductase
MASQVLILGGRGRIGQQVAADVIAYTQAAVTVTGRNPSLPNPDAPLRAIALDLADRDRVTATIQALKTSADQPKNVVVHCAGPFHYRDTDVLQACINAGVNYVDVSDHPSYTRKVVKLCAAAETAGVTAIVNTGIFPGISNSMVRHDVEQLDQTDHIHLSYVVGGSGGAGLTVMRTTFLGLQKPFQAWIGGQWQTVKPYSDRELIEFPPPYGRVGVYWFDMPETFTLPEAFPAQTVVTKFGSAPDFYNHLTWSVAHGWHPRLLQTPAVIEFLSRVSYAMTKVTDRFSGIGVAIRSCVTGHKNGHPASYCSTLTHTNTAIAAGIGTGSIVQLLLAGHLHQPGVWTVEQALPTVLFQEVMAQRHLKLHSGWLPSNK